MDNSGNPVLRSASFHGRDVFSQEDDSDSWEQNSLHYYRPVDDWHKLPQPPAVSIFSLIIILVKFVELLKNLMLYDIVI